MIWKLLVVEYASGYGVSKIKGTETEPVKYKGEKLFPLNKDELREAVQQNLQISEDDETDICYLTKTEISDDLLGFAEESYKTVETSSWTRESITYAAIKLYPDSAIDFTISKEKAFRYTPIGADSSNVHKFYLRCKADIDCSFEEKEYGAAKTVKTGSDETEIFAETKTEDKTEEKPEPGVSVADKSENAKVNDIPDFDSRTGHAYTDTDYEEKQDFEGAPMFFAKLGHRDACAINEKDN